jgi:hypothetical protein
MCVKTCEVDFFVELFNRGLHKLLQDIILTLDARSILACLEVSDDWCQIVRFYRDSKSLKFQRQRSIKIAQEWRKKNPVILTVTLEKFNIFQVDCLHIIGDEHEVAIAALVNGTHKGKIILIDPKTVVVKSVLDITNSDGENLDVLEMKMSMDQNFLVSFIRHEKNCYYKVWNRKEDYNSTMYPLKNCQPEHWHKKFALIDSHLQNVPLIREGMLCINTNPYRMRVEFEEWKISEDTQSTTSIHFPCEVYQFHVQNFGALIRDFNKKLTYFNEGVQWSIPYGDGVYPKVAGYSDKYVAIHWYHMAGNVLRIHRVTDGRSVLKLYIEPTEHWQPSFILGKFYRPFFKEGLNQVQISKSRVAFKGSLRTGRLDPGNQIDDLTIIDLKTGDIILSCVKDLGLHSNKSFLLQNENLVLENLGKIVFAKFWL